jgi:hypothetical protein
MYVLRLVKVQEKMVKDGYNPGMAMPNPGGGGIGV